MSAKFLYVRARERGTNPEPSPELAAYASEWRLALATADRACCCLAKPVVVAVMPMTSVQDKPVELLLCGHHYRTSREALAEAGAIVVDATGMPITTQCWPSPSYDVDTAADHGAAVQ